MENVAKLNSVDNAEIIEVRITKENYPIAYNNKLEELIEVGGMTKEEAEEYLMEWTIPMELVYHKGYGLFMVESEAVESSPIYSPYTGEECDDSEVNG